jgi:putative RecB family exonuclease
MPRKPTLSPTKLSTYLACPMKYHFTYVRPQRALLKAKSYYSFGNTLHRVLEQFASNPDRGVDPQATLNELYDENWIDAGYTSAEEMADAYAVGKEILERADSELLAIPPDVITAALEKTFRLDMGEFDLVGRVDRIDQHPDGMLEVLDYKSGRGEVTDAQVASDIAMSCYQLLVRRSIPDHPVRATLLSLRTRSRGTASMSDEELAEFEFSVRELGVRILNHEWSEMGPIRKGLCEGCDFISLCKRHPEF